MDDKLKKMNFKDFLTVDYTKTDDEFLSYQAHKRHRGVVGEDVDDVEEALSRQARLKASQRMKRMSKRIQMAKKRAMKRAPTSDVVKNRARKQARSQMLKKWTRGQEKGDMSIGRRAELEKRLKKAQPKVDRLAKKLIPTIRKQDRARRSSASSTGEKK